MFHCETALTAIMMSNTCVLLLQAYLRTSYSDRADLPMSQKWREEMKANSYFACSEDVHVLQFVWGQDKLSSVDTEKLTVDQKRKFKD